MFETQKGIGRYGKEVEFTRSMKIAWLVVIGTAILLGMLNDAMNPGYDQALESIWREAHSEKAKINREYDKALRDFERR
jgi:hypothetical protein